MIWNDENIALLVDLQSKKYSGRRIAAELGITRNSAMGKLARMGLSCESSPPVKAGTRRPNPKRAAQLASTPRLSMQGKRIGRKESAPPDGDTQRSVTAFNFMRPSSPRRPPAKAADTITEPIPRTACTLLELPPGACRWPLGAPLDPPHLFCGGKAIDGLPYCHVHCRIAYQPARSRL